MSKRRVLVFPAGTEIGLEIFHALSNCKEVCIFGAGQNVSNPARFVYPEYYVLPAIGETSWLEELISICLSLRIDYVFPAYDDVLVALSRERDRVPAKIISSPAETCEVTRSKSETYRLLGDTINVPRLYASAEEVDMFPVFVKPDRGQGSVGIARVEDQEALALALGSTHAPIICEYLPGDEYTIDCFSDREKGLLFVGARRRCRVRNGISVNTITVSLPEASEIAHLIASKIVFHGAWFFQLKRNRNERLTLLEVAPRIAGGMAAHRVAGVNFPLLSIFEEERLPLSVRPLEGGVELDRALGNRYLHSIKYSKLYIDLDDTLVVNDQINILAVKLLFQCINKGIKISLITRHQSDLAQTLKKHRLSGLFDEIIRIGKMEKKSSYIDGDNSIFVDDSFSERMDVAECCRIPTFDCSMIELLTEQAEFMNGDS